MIDWNEKYPKQQISSTKVRCVGLAMAMQGSGISFVDTASAEVRLQDNGYYTLMIGATDMGTGCDTILSQMAADCLGCDLNKIIVNGVDTDQSPYDTGSYASSTTYVTGNAVVKACNDLLEKIKEAGADALQLQKQAVDFDGERVFSLEEGKEIGLDELAQKLVFGSNRILTGNAAHSSPVSPPPFMTGFAEVEVDLETGEVDVIQYAGVVDCGTVINKNLARLQAEGGIVQGIGMALFEDIQYNERGRMMNNSFMQYKLPTRLDVGNVMVDFEESYEPSGPFGAKSVGEIVINTPCPAIAHAVYNATGVWVRDLPITPEKILRGLEELRCK